MSASFDITSSTGAYRVEIRRGLLADLLGDRKAVVLCDERFEAIVRKADVPYAALPAEEPVKSLEAMTPVIVRLRELGTNRKTHLIAIGGGIIQDVAAFAATIYMRGLAWSYLPTTLLGMADSCIGGKSSINVGTYKNLVGTFYPPKAVLIDPDLLSGLPIAQRAAGLCEAAKICFAKGVPEFEAYLAEGPSVDMPLDGFERVIGQSLRAKKWFIETDEFDRGERLLLNFGHTFGHALEGASNFALSHGVAVGLGILCAIDLGTGLGRRYGGPGRVDQLRRHIEGLLGTVEGLKSVVAGILADEACRVFLADKKHDRETFAVIVINQTGAVERLLLPRTDESLSRIKGAFTSLIERYRP